ncbi:LOW QUALITY PROTEIN: P2Y purinoceptor 1-like [Phaethornis superciliosus]
MFGTHRSHFSPVLLHCPGCAGSQITQGFSHLNLYTSISFLPCISIHCYLSIVHPQKAWGRCQGGTSLAWLSAMGWVWVVAQGPNFTFSKMGDTGVWCHDTTGVVPWCHKDLGVYLLYTVTVTLPGFIIPFLIIIGCYCHIVVVVPCRNDTMEPSLRRSSIRLVILVMVFSICFLPYHIFRNLNLLSRGWQLQALKNIYISYQVTQGLASCNTALNPLLYVVTSEGCTSWVRTIHQKAGQSLGSTSGRKTSCQADEKMSIFLCEEEASEEL